MAILKNSFGTKSTLNTSDGQVNYFSLSKLADSGFTGIDRLPFSIKILLENLVRNEDGIIIKTSDIENMGRWDADASVCHEVPFMPARILLQDFTGVPSLVDMAGMREAAKRLQINPTKINPTIPVELIIDHSVQVDSFGSKESFEYNVEKEFERNFERYTFLRWGQKNFENFNVVPPATGIIHQVNLEYLARVIFVKNINGQRMAFPDTLIGLDSHTTMINGLGVVGWGVGGIEAEAVMLGSPYYLLTPQVIGFQLTGELPEGTTATDLVLTITELLRKKGVVGKFVEFFGPGVNALSLEDRATIANMAPEYGATMGFFPVDDETINYLRLTGRPDNVITLIESYCKEQGIFRTETMEDPLFNDTIQLDMGKIEPSMAGPRRPQERIPLSKIKKTFINEFKDASSADGSSLSNGSVVIASITSCTNTSNPNVLIGAGLLAKKAVERGLSVKPWVKTSFAPGSKAAINYLKAAELMPYLEALKFHLVAYGCTTCIGNSGPLSKPVADTIKKHNLVVASVISGNRNFEGRISPLTRANFLASPPLVIAFAISGKVTIDFAKEPIALDNDGKPVYLHEIWPSTEEIKKTVKRVVRPEMYKKAYENAFEGSNQWQALPVPEGTLFNWDPKSTYIKEPPFLKDLNKTIPELQDIKGARILALLGDSVTTDHISPAGAIPVDSPAGAYLIDQGLTPSEFNSFGSRRGNHEVMLRGTFGNIRLKNKLVPGIDGGWTVFLPDGKKMTIYEAAMQYQKEATPLLIIAGKNYGTGSSRDWAAKGTYLLGIKAVIAESFERIHRSNLICMGILPLQFKPGENHKSLDLDGTETYEIAGIENKLEPLKELTVFAQGKDSKRTKFRVIARIDSPIELNYYRHGGILAYVLRNM
ncbi:MAG: aconitate hydratase AcnA [Proteobacteria bacterium]|nr:aconitate hydratase AcnA [Pseudomonadota bacterium]MBU4013433.1 aconitate hydratase AcnA [Pseudomonadota bacterium]MBU4068741.1 aconitate hydratase AcnA [Pseudomonadota bacterium]MBU4100199.1 aconitate hydratase AcnA [Pseudomonadota bacterium]MBU4127170.1 aconitate hydratase AcnA [Pseudomonadota bacterium]